MKMSFTVLSDGESCIDQYVNDNGSVVTQKEKGDLTERMVEFAGAAISESAEIEKQRTLYMAAVFFQRVVNRTPVDEDYWYLDKKTDDMRFHRADDDSVRKAWVIRGSGFLSPRKNLWITVLSLTSLITRVILIKFIRFSGMQLKANPLANFFI